ncbi:MAG: ATP-binding protein [Actinomycetota bacterium]|nr:ATP-binding protein [Actinomycetota bacterium]
MPPASGFVVVGGPPASGKTTLVAALAPRLGLPVLAKDTIKEALMGALPPAGIDDSRRLGGASMEVLFALAAASPGAILEANWWATITGPRIAALAGPVVEVFCSCDPELARRRYLDRAADRHRGHFDSIRDFSSLYTADSCRPVAGGWPVIEVDTSRPVNVDGLVEQIGSALTIALNTGG